MKNRLAVAVTIGAFLILTVSMALTKAYAAKNCTASCPAGWTQIGGSCPGVINNCPANCTGALTCQSVSTGTPTTIQVPCQCKPL